MRESRSSQSCWNLYLSHQRKRREYLFVTADKFPDNCEATTCDPLGIENRGVSPHMAQLKSKSIFGIFISSDGVRFGITQLTYFSKLII